jgi:hypothetical protein
MQIQFCFSCEHLVHEFGKEPARHCKKFQKILIVNTNGFITGFQRCDECLKETENHFKKYEEKKSLTK